MIYGNLWRLFNNGQPLFELSHCRPGRLDRPTRLASLGWPASALAKPPPIASGRDLITCCRLARGYVNHISGSSEACKWSLELTCECRSRGRLKDGRNSIFAMAEAWPAERAIIVGIEGRLVSFERLPWPALWTGRGACSAHWMQIGLSRMAVIATFWRDSPRARPGDNNKCRRSPVQLICRSLAESQLYNSSPQ